MMLMGEVAEITKQIVFIHLCYTVLSTFVWPFNMVEISLGMAYQENLAVNQLVPSPHLASVEAAEEPTHVFSITTLASSGAASGYCCGSKPMEFLAFHSKLAGISGWSE